MAISGSISNIGPDVDPNTEPVAGPELAGPSDVTHGSLPLTVVVPVHNRAAKVVRMLGSLRRQSVQPAEVIVVDNGSTDDTVSAVSRFFDDWRRQTGDSPVPALTLLHDPTSGACHARNTGLEAVRTEWTMFFDSDDVMLPGHLARAAGTVTPLAQIVGWDVVMTREPVNDGGDDLPVSVAGGTVKPFETNDIAYHNLFHATLATQRYMARTQLFRDAGGWNVDVPIWNDIELGNRLLKQLGNKPDAIVKTQGPPLVCVYTSPQSITGCGFAERADKYGAALACFEAALPSRLQPWVNLKRIILAADMAREGSPAGPELYRQVMRGAAGRFRLILPTAYLYARIGGRGAARLLRPLMPKS